MRDFYSELTQEVRFAVVLYGGVSLAIYINGVAQELLRLVRATSPVGELHGSERVYAKLGALLRRGHVPTEPAADGSVRTRFRIDVISGTSAGGINGVFLAKALANESDLTPLQELWFQEGAIEELLNDRKSYRGIKAKPPRDTESLLNSKRMYMKLLEALDGMDRGERTAPSEEGTESRLADEIDLFATTTDLEGVPVQIQLFDNIVYERRFRNAFHLQYRKARQRNDFNADNNPFIAFAARCTSAFPFAFEPMRLCDIDDVMDSSNIYAAKKYCRSSSDRWKKFYTNYLNPTAAAHVEFPARAFGDGGYLDNAPFSHAIDALLAREAAVPVDRKLLYVEPSPHHPEEEPLATEKPDAIENSLAALIGIPRYETIREDLARALQRNRTVTKVRKTIAQVEIELEERIRTDPRFSNAMEPAEFPLEQSEITSRVYYRLRATEVTDRLALVIARMLEIDDESAYYAALRSLIRAWRERRYEVDPSEKGRATDKGGLYDFLRHFDLPYRLRRLRFLLRKIDDLHNLELPDGHPDRHDAEMTLHFAFGAGAPAEAHRMRDDLGALRKTTARQFEALRQLLADLEGASSPTPREGVVATDTAPPPRSWFSDVKAALPRRETVIALLRHILGTDGQGAPAEPVPAENYGTDGGIQGSARLLMSKPIIRQDVDPGELELLCDRNARRLLDDPANAAMLDHLRGIGEGLEGLLREVLKETHEDLTREASAGRAYGMLRFYTMFDYFDAAQYPMMFGTAVVEADPVEIIRVSPEDAPSLVPEARARRQKLKGTVIANFGAFLERAWRENDLLWGRLDAADRIISALLPHASSKRLRDELIDEAQDEIIREFDLTTRVRRAALEHAVAQNRGAARDGTRAIETAVQAAARPPANRRERAELLKVYGALLPPEMERSRLMRAGARATEIVGRMLETIADRKGTAPKMKLVTHSGRALWGLIEISVPRSAGELLGRYWLSLALAIELVLILGGTLLGNSGAAQLGWTLLGLTAIVWGARRLVSAFIRGPGPFHAFLRTAALGFVLALCVLLFFGAVHVRELFGDVKAAAVAPMDSTR